MTYRPFQCSDCGAQLAARDVASESKHYVSGTASTRVRSASRYCGECHSANEYKRNQAMLAYQAEVIASLTDDQRAAYYHRRSVNAEGERV